MTWVIPQYLGDLFGLGHGLWLKKKDRILWKTTSLAAC